MDIKKEMEKVAGRVEAYLDEMLPGDRYPEELYVAMRYSLLSGGKRVRPFLAYEVFSLFSSDMELILPFCAAVEMIHTYSLIHDDLPCMDDDEIRRGKPSSHVKFGEAQALLAGDALLTEAFRLLTRGKLDPDKKIRLVEALSRAAGCRGMVGGQFADIENEGNEGDQPILEYIHMNKTGELIRVCCEAGAIAGGGDGEQLDAANEYGRWLGLTFQIVDDILDEISDSVNMGKATGKDREKGKLTYPAFFGLEESRRMAESYTRKAVLALDKLPGDNSLLKEFTEYMCRRVK